MKLHAMQAVIREVNTVNGWYGDDRTFGDDVALLHSEVSEALEAYRRWGLEDATGDLCDSWPDGTHLHSLDGTPCKPEGFGSEIADVLIRYLDMVERRHGPDYFGGEHNGVTLAEVIAGLDPVKEVLSTPGDWLAWLHREIATSTGVPGTLWKVRILEATVRVAVEHKVDLEDEVTRKVAFNRTRGHRHGGKLL